ncbi:MAG: 50S ribosomal protein L33 [Kiritimatiellia bacterium]
MATTRTQAIMECTECHRRNYTTTRNPKTQTSRLELLKFCPHDRRRTIHKEIKGR